MIGFQTRSAQPGLPHGRFPKFHRVFVGPRLWHIEIRHRVKRKSTINLFEFETLKLKIRRFGRHNRGRHRGALISMNLSLSLSLSFSLSLSLSVNIYIYICVYICMCIYIYIYIYIYSIRVATCGNMWRHAWYLWTNVRT